MDFLTVGALPVPTLTEADAENLVGEHFGLTVSARSLGSQQDANFLLTEPDGSILGVLRVANPAFTAAELDAQDAAADHIALRDPELRVATLVHRDKPLSTIVPTPDGPTRARVLRYLPGGTLSERHYLSPRAIAALGELAARASRALSDFEHAGLERRIQWDLRHSDDVVAHLIEHVEGAEQQRRLREAVDQAWVTVSEFADQLPRQALHHDVTDTNVVCSVYRGVAIPDGIIDFGDLTHSWAVGDLAVTISSVLHHPGVEPSDVLPAIRAFDAIRPLSDAEVAVLWPLVVVRTAVCVMSSEHQLLIDAENSYASESMADEWAMFDQATSVPVAVMTALVREALGHDSPPPLPVHGSLLATSTTAAELDWGWDSDLANSGAWLEQDARSGAAHDLLNSGAPLVVTAFAQPQLTETLLLSPQSSATIPTGIDLWCGEQTALIAPWDGEVTVSPGRIELRGDSACLIVSSDVATHVTSGSVKSGTVLVTVPERIHVHVTVARVDAPEIPRWVRPEYARGWLSLVGDPAPLIGANSASEVPAETLVQRRVESLASVQEHYYESPPQIERGWRHYMLDTHGRAYVDMVNNVTILGHAHPGVADAVERQLRRLNTNSRFNYSNVVEFCERLTALLPEPLDTVFLVNSGSEATDLAMRLALIATGRSDLVAVGEAYHGWTYLSDAVSTSTADNPIAWETRPDFVHVLDAPNSYRGVHRGANASQYAADAVKRIDELAAIGSPPAAIIAETFYGNAGGVALPDGYLDAVYAAIRAHGGLAIADEVQVGYGRLGQWFWGFEQQQVLPDIVAVAKAMGNGHPLGAVVTSREIAEQFRTQGYFFSSTGGSPVSSAVGIAVLDAVRDEGLQNNALLVGSHLKARLMGLAERHPIIGTVHGEGLYLGVELVRDRDTLEPATEETSAICDRLLSLGVIVQPTGDRMCILKVKPPLCLDQAAADYFVDTLDRVLTEGW